MQAVLYNRGTSDAEVKYDPEKVDFAISLQLGKVHVIFLYWFLRRVLGFMEAFQSATDYAVAKASEVTDAAKTQVQQVVNQATSPRIALAINIEAPVIYMPQNSKSRSALVFDLGHISVKNQFEVVPKPISKTEDSDDVLMMDHMSVTLEDLRMSAALLVDGGIAVDRNVIQPINLSLHMSRKVFPSKDDGVPLFVVSGALESVRLSMTFGDYKLVNEVFVDNFEEADNLLGPTLQSNTVDSENAGLPVNVYEENTKKASNATQEALPHATDKNATWNFVLKRLEVELFSGTNDTKNWNEEIHASRRLGVFTCTELHLEGDVLADNSSNVTARLKDVSLTDTRPHSTNHIVNILSQAGDSQNGASNFIEVFYHSDTQSNQTLDVNVCSIMVCASLDYFMILSKFFIDGAPQSKTPSTKPVPPPSRKSLTAKATRTVSTHTPPSPKIGTLAIKTNIDDPEIILPEDMSNPNCNAILITTSLDFSYTMLQEETVMNASIGKFRVLACPFQREKRENNSMELIPATSVFFYARQSISSALHGTINMDSLIINVNASVIRSISKIVNQLSEETFATSLNTPSAALPRHTSEQGADLAGDFWAAKPIKATDIPIPQGQLAYADPATEAESCDVANLLLEVDERCQEKILVSIKYVCLSMESQIGRKQVPMLLMEANIEGEIKSPSTSLEVSLNFELTVSYYNDHVNEWEQLLETLPEDGNRLWSMQLEYTSGEQEDPHSKKDRQTMSNVKNSGYTLSLLSQDNLEITISKTALDVLSKLGKSFEDAYVSPTTTVAARETVAINAPYLLRNQTGLRLVVLVDGQRLRTTEDSPADKSGSSHNLTAAKQRVGLVGHILNSGDNLGLYDALMNKAPTVQNLRSSPISPPRSINLGLSPEPISTAADWGSVVSQTAAIKIHRTANYIVSVASIKDVEKCLPIVANITAFLGQKTLYLQSTLQLVNEAPHAIRIYSFHSSDGKVTQDLLTVVAGGTTYPLPVEVVTAHEVTGILMCPDLDEASPSTDVVYWPSKACPQTARRSDRGETCIYLLPRSDSTGVGEWPVQNVACPVPLKAGAGTDLIVYNYTVTIEPRFSDAEEERPIFVQPPSAAALEPSAYNMVIRTPASLHNHLPVPINLDANEIRSEVEAGHTSVLYTVNPTEFSFSIYFTYDKKDYFGRIVFNSKTEEISLLQCETHDGYDISFLNLGLRCLRRLGHVDLTVYSSYWMVNKTGLSLSYKDQTEFEVHHPANFPGVLLYSVVSKAMFLQHKSSSQLQLHSLSDSDPEKGDSNTSASATPQHHWHRPFKARHRGLHLARKVKIVMRTDDSLWSPKFSLDTVGSWDRVHCEGTLGRSYEIGVKINLSASGLTKIITFMPYFMIVNKSPITIECAQVRDTTQNITDSWISVEAGDVKPFWPATGDTQKMLMTCRLDKNTTSNHFPLYESITILLKLPNPYIGLYADVQTTNEATVINLQLYKEGMALVHIINDLDGQRDVFFYQKGTGVTHTLKAGYRIFYTWDDASKPRQFFAYLGNPQKAKQVEITTDSYEVFVFENTNIHVVSFLSKLQRTLLLTTDPMLANLTAKFGELESVTDSISLVLQSIGISMVANQLCQEICYISIRSSDVLWNKMKRGNQMKPLKPDVSEALESLYTSFLNKLQLGEEFPKRITLPQSIRPTTTVDMNQMVMLEPENCALQRTFEPGIQIQYRASLNQMQIHAKIFRLQVDSQRLDSTFPVVFAPFPQSASVVVESGPKSLVEIFAVICKTTDKEVYRFKRLECLIQEMQFKLDQGFLNDMIDFCSGSVTVQDELEGFLSDQKLTRGELVDAPVVKDVLYSGKESIIDYMHISPIKMHVSFSLVGGSQEGQPSALHSDVVKLFLQSLGVALTDVQDVVFKLGYFERRGRIMSFSKILAEMARYYTGQAIKQTYVLILGLDVIGNPFGVIRGMAQGVEDLFYEPVKGAVIGTEEFAEGVALGVKSLFGHTVGGAAGAMSRITGTLGKGVAALTLDDDYKRRRREEMTRAPENFGVGMARGGKGLVMGVVGGVTGIITQPMAGAKKDGVEGFFRGLGKGLIGTVTRPISGVVDFASSSLEGIRRVTSTSKDVLPVRPSRFIGLDGVIRPYDRNEAEGNVLLNQFRDKSTSEEYVYHVPIRRPKGVCLLTTERILVITMNEMLGSCTLDWDVPLSLLNGVPQQYDGGLEIRLSKVSKTKLFASTSNTKQIECSVDHARRMLWKIRNVLGEGTSAM
uniref:VPS13_mid_rpt domain-containing protein n=1 Tax=Mesocestoides corti TaxID=53468 RepID=A0A5K3F607_MESCO